MYAYIPLWIMLLQYGLCVFFILFILTLNILFLGTEICIFSNANAISKSCDFCVHFSQLSHECYNACLQYILFLYVQKDQYLVCLFHTFFSVIICPILILEIISNIPESGRRNNNHFRSAQIIHLLRFHTNELRYTTLLVDFLDGLSSWLQFRTFTCKLILQLCYSHYQIYNLVDINENKLSSLLIEKLCYLSVSNFWIQ